MDALAPHVDVRRFLVPKTGNTQEECEDALHISSSADASSLFAAVSDGASESLLAGAWAGKLVHGAVASMEASADEPGTAEIGDLSGTFIEGLLTRTVDRWDDYVAEYQVERATRGRPIAWYEQPGLDKGAFATLMAVHIRTAPAALEGREGVPHWSWRAFALGDSCLFHLRDGRLITSFPITDGQGFGITPQLLGSRNRDAALIADRASTATGELHVGDDLLMATDALAAWLLSHPDIDSGGAGRQLGNLAELDHEDFSDWVRDQRAKSLMRNDDVALIRMRMKTEG